MHGKNSCRPKLSLSYVAREERNISEILKYLFDLLRSLVTDGSYLLNLLYALKQWPMRKWWFLHAICIDAYSVGLLCLQLFFDMVSSLQRTSELEGC